MLYIILVAVLLLLDQAVKYWVSENLELNAGLTLIPGVIELRRVHNYGAAWSSFAGMRWALVIVTSAIVLFVAVMLITKRIRQPLGKLSGCLIIAGGLGNIIDRVRLGYVVDMFNFLWIRYPVFNVADICVVSGALLGAVWYLRFYNAEGSGS